ncbi:hypothetical protein FQA39_LY17981 [Lamprigera yunnana]|nr:hypothetical protein FQA39_LY17981 [Lamprigera yunnana]
MQPNIIGAPSTSTFGSDIRKHDVLSTHDQLLSKIPVPSTSFQSFSPLFASESDEVIPTEAVEDQYEKNTSVLTQTPPRSGELYFPSIHLIAIVAFSDTLLKSVNVSRSRHLKDQKITLKSGFRESGISPVDPQHLTHKTPEETKWKVSFQEFVMEQRTPEISTQKRDKSFSLLQDRVFHPSRSQRYLNKALLYITNNTSHIIALRQNSIMKEDTSYLTFNINSLFVPVNWLGAMTMDDPSISARTDIDKMIRHLIESSRKWDEGYFAHLRKLLLIIYQWKNGGQSASWDIGEFCAKTNECLLDNTNDFLTFAAKVCEENNNK